MTSYSDPIDSLTILRIPTENLIKFASSLNKVVKNRTEALSTLNVSEHNTIDYGVTLHGDNFLNTVPSDFEALAY